MYNWMNKWIAFSAQRAWMLSILALGLFFASGYLAATKLRVDGQLEALLPADSPTLVALRETQQRFGSTDMYTIAIQGRSAQEVAQLQDQVLADLKKWPDVVSAQAERSQQFFSDHALYFLPPDELTKIRDALQAQKAALADFDPLAAEILGTPVPKVEYKPDPELPKKLGLPDEAAAAFKQFLGSESTAQTKTPDYDPKAELPDSLGSRLIGKTQDGRWVGVIQAVLQKPSSDIDYVKTVLARSKVMLAPHQQANPTAKIEVTGPYKDLEEVNTLEKNGLWATLIAVALTFLIIIVFFRSFGSVLVIIYQALLSCAVVLALSVFLFGRLNLYTVFVVAILFGAGTNYPIFLLGYAQNLLKQGIGWTEALQRTYTSLFTSLLTACTTIAAGMLVLLVSRFSGFFEFGVLGAIGIVLSMVLTMVFLPAHLFVMEQISHWKVLKLRLMAWISPRATPAVGWQKWVF